MTRVSHVVRQEFESLKVTRLLFWVLPLVFFTLFPIGWLGEVYRPVGRVLDNHFGSVTAHAVAHALIFFLLGLALLGAFPVLRARPLLFFGVVLLFALGQEGLQLLYKQRPLVYDDFRDLVVDGTGAAAAYALFRALGANRTKDSTSTLRVL
ncbi:MAG: hypothetical protein RLZZ387_4852 [Chloroflexota bacterium]|jgi:hypothetical protein